MILRKATFPFLAFLLACVALPANADRAEDAVKSRQGLMQLNSFNIGGLAAMAKGEQPYDADVAKTYAGNLNQLSHMDIFVLFPEGTDEEAMAGKTNALKVIWTTFPAIKDKQTAWRDATENLVETAGAGLDEMKAGLGQLGNACKGCHDTYRKPF